jgi:hypothetical protein
VLYGLPPDLSDGLSDGGAEAGGAGRPRVSAGDVRAEANDLAVMWGGTPEAHGQAEAWANQRLAALGLEDRASAQEAAPAFEVDHDLVAPARIFMAAATQWRTSIVAGLGGGMRYREGLDYTALPVIAGALGLAFDPAAFEGVQVLERETLALDTDRHQIKQHRTNQRGGRR